MQNDSELLDVVGDIYDCAIEPKRWPQALERICGSMEMRRSAPLRSRT